MKIILPSVLCEEIIPNVKFQNNWQTHNLRGRINGITDHIKREIRPDTYYDFKECLQFDTLGNVVEVKAWNAQEQVMKWNRFTYDQNGNYTGKTSLDEDGSLFHKLIFTFDEHGNMVERVKYDRDGVEEEKIAYSYDIYGNIIKSATKYAYDAQGRCTLYESRGDRSEFIYTDNTIEEIFYSDGTLRWKVLSQYNESDQLIKRISQSASGGRNIDFEDSWQYDAFGNLIAYIKKQGEAIHKRISWYSECEYDDHGNWIRNTTYNPDRIMRSDIQRKIEYY